MNEIIKAQHLHKTYRIFAGPSALLREMLRGGIHHQAIHALVDLTFSVAKGQSFGVIGRNGAGKSTLLKVVTGTTFPTQGDVEVHGRVSALLELGAGFHPEFTGRENIRFSGALAGADRDEIRGREDDIIHFSELGEFIEHPVKTYSSGMFVRLGFAVATGFEPDILIIDEALAVGDEPFQKKCTDRIVHFRQQGGTILFCSHNMHQVKTLCSEAVWLNKGAIAAIGAADDVVADYRDFLREQGSSPDGPGAPTTSGEPLVCELKEVELLDEAGCSTRNFRTGETVAAQVTAYFSDKFEGQPGVGIGLMRNDGIEIYTVTSTMDDVLMEATGEPGNFQISLVYPEIPLLPGKYYLNVALTDADFLQAYSVKERAVEFSIRGEGKEPGLLRLEHYWSTPK